MLIAALAWQANAAADRAEYPPPPGSYRGDTGLPIPLPTDPSPVNAHAADADKATPTGGSRLLPLPHEPLGGGVDRYDADTLFGSPTRHEPAPAAIPEWEPPLRAEPPRSPRSASPAAAPEQPRTDHDFSMNFRRGTTERTTAPRPPAPQAGRYPGYPPRPDTYFGYQQHPGGYPPAGGPAPAPIGPHGVQGRYTAPLAAQTSPFHPGAADTSQGHPSSPTTDGERVRDTGYQWGEATGSATLEPVSTETPGPVFRPGQ